MKKMSIEYSMIRSELENLTRELERHKDNELSHKDMIAVSDLLAETVHMIRKKYGITTMYYLVSEMKAADGIGPDETHEYREGEWLDDCKNSGWVKCSGCGYQEFWNRKSKFCPSCGRRMKV